MIAQMHGLKRRSWFSLVTGAALMLMAQALPAAAQSGVIQDFNGDNRSDMLWRDSAGGSLAVWHMDGLRIEGASNIPGPPRADTGWQTVGTGDFNGDDWPDLLWWNSRSGEYQIWLMRAVSPIGAGTIRTVAPALGWQVAGIADFNGDGRDDILWRQVTTSDVQLALMDGLREISSARIGLIDESWKIVGLADLNGDGLCDIAWQRNVTTTSTGTTGSTSTTTSTGIGWLMSGATRTSQVAISIPAGKSAGGTGGTGTGTSSSTVPPTVAAVADFNGDGRDDILWRQQTGELQLAVTGVGGASGSAVALAFGDLTGWTLVGAADISGDGQADLVWQENATGMLGAWLMNGVNVTRAGTIRAAAAPWVPGARFNSRSGSDSTITGQPVF